MGLAAFFAGFLAVFLAAFFLRRTAMDISGWFRPPSCHLSLARSSASSLLTSQAPLADQSMLPERVLVGGLPPAAHFGSPRSSLSQVLRTCSPALRAALHPKWAWPRTPKGRCL